MLVKAPIYGLHSWLPRAHVEAPVIGSVVLAGLLLKLGTVGYLRLLRSTGDTLSLAVVVLGRLGVLLGRLVGCVQSDLKATVAYRSVAHMNLVV